MISSVLPTYNFLTDKWIDYVSIQNEEIILLIRNLNPNKPSGSDGISGEMLPLWRLGGYTSQKLTNILKLLHIHACGTLQMWFKYLIIPTDN